MKTFTKHILCRLDGRKCVTHVNGEITINVDVSVKIVMCVKMIMFGILLHVVVNIQYKKSIYKIYKF